MKKIHVWIENKDGEVFCVGCFALNEEWHMPRGILSPDAQISITYEEEKK